MAYTAKCDTAAATKWWITGTGSTIDRLSEVMDDNAAGVEEDDNPGNYQPWTTFMTEHVEDCLYQILLDFDVGDGTIVTELTSIRGESVHVDTGVNVVIKNNATLQFGILDAIGSEGAFWSFSPTGTTQWMIGDSSANAVFNVYGSYVHNRANSRIIWRDGTVDFRDSTFAAEFPYTSTQAGRGYQIYRNVDSVNISNLLALNVQSFDLNAAATVDGFTINDCLKAVSAQFIDGTTLTLSNISTEVSNVTNLEVDLNKNGENHLELVDIDFVITRLRIGHVDSDVKEQYTVNINIVDPWGNALQTATVLCENTNGTQEFSVTTDASGDISEQTITRRQWATTSETETDYNDFKFTISKPGYETLVIDAVTVSAPIVWRQELQHMKPKILGRPNRRIHASSFN